MRRLISSMGIRRYYSLGFKSVREGLVCLLGASFGERRLEVDAGQGNAEVRDPWLVEGPLSHEPALSFYAKLVGISWRSNSRSAHTY
jgi:hypothetical protein